MEFGNGKKLVAVTLTVLLMLLGVVQFGQTQVQAGSVAAVPENHGRALSSLRSDPMAAEVEDREERDLRRRRRKKGKGGSPGAVDGATRAPTMSPDVPESGCAALGTSFFQCNGYDDCYIKKKKCTQTKSKRLDVYRVLFVGNSFTIRNNLPGLFSSIAKSRGKEVTTFMRAAGSRSFNSHSSDPATDLSINGFANEDVSNDWDYVVLQEQSMLLSTPSYQYSVQSLPFAQKLYEQIKATDAANVLLYQTWGYRSGNPSWGNWDDTYYTMQERLKTGYEAAKSRMETVKGPNDPPVEIAYVGEAWELAFPQFESKLYDWDGRHPAMHGSYLAALVFYAKIYQDSPIGVSYRPKKVSSSDARKLQEYAHQVVFG